VVYRDRFDAGQRLGQRLLSFQYADVVVLGLSRGGVPVAFEVARVLGAPLDVAVVRKLGVSFQPELAMGAVGEDGALVLNHEVLALAGVGRSEFVAIEQRERAELERRASRYRNGGPRISLADRTAVVVDDGIATGSTALVACQVARARGAARVVLAVPVASPSTAAELARHVDELVCLTTPDRLFAVGQWYRDFSPTTDKEVIALLSKAVDGTMQTPANRRPGTRTRFRRFP
jgi:putative phosphoribosyl transferase